MLLRRSGILTRALCPNGGCAWSPATAVCINSLLFNASGSDLYWTAQLRVQWTSSVEQSATSLTRTHVTGYIQDKTENFPFPTFTVTFVDHPALLRRFRDFGAVI